MNMPAQAQTPRGPSLLPAVPCHLSHRLKLEHHNAHPSPAPPAQHETQSFTGSWQRAHTSQGCSSALLTKPLRCLSSTSNRLVDNQERSMNSARATCDMTYSLAWDHARAPRTLSLEPVSLLQTSDSTQPSSLSHCQLWSHPCHQYKMGTSNPL